MFLFNDNRDDVSLRLGRGAGGVLDSLRAGAAPALINMLDEACSTIHVAIYSISSRSIVDTLVALLLNVEPTGRDLTAIAKVLGQ